MNLEEDLLYDLGEIEQQFSRFLISYMPKSNLLELGFWNTNQLDIQNIYFSDDITLKANEKRLGFYLVQQAGSMVQEEEEESEEESSSEESGSDRGEEDDK